MKIKCKTNDDTVTIELPDKGEGLQYLWIGLGGKYLASVESERSLKTLQKMITAVLANNKKAKPRKHKADVFEGRIS